MLWFGSDFATHWIRLISLSDLFMNVCIEYYKADLMDTNKILFSSRDIDCPQVDKFYLKNCLKQAVCKPVGIYFRFASFDLAVSMSSDVAIHMSREIYV